MTEPLEMQLFLAALDMPAEGRAAFVAGIEDASVQGRVAKLLEADDELGEDDELSPDAHGGTPPALARLHDVESLVGLEFDGLRIVGVLGRGGMGVVLDAEQQSPRRRVAVKTLPAFAGGPDAARRLEMEARLLARLAHPGIAQVIGSGCADALGGQPYLVMERIDGEPIDDFVVRHALDQRARLELLAQTFDAVAHAHGRGVIHRDLKPGNILVTADGQPKVLDFGIARLTEDAEDAPSLSLRTRTGQILGTLPYMSPEQLSGDPLQVDVQTDVYALGVLAWQVLAGGRLPIDVAELPLASAVRRLSESVVPKLGTIDRSFRGDLELVVATALEHDVARRYGTVAEFSAELRRVLSGSPIVARPPSRGYQLRMLVRRHRMAAAAVLLVFLALAIGLGVALHERGKAIEARREVSESARIDRLRSESMKDLFQLLMAMVQQANSGGMDGGGSTMAEFVDGLAGVLDLILVETPQVSGMAHLLVGRNYVSRDDIPKARHHLDECRKAFERSELATVEDMAMADLLESSLRMRNGDLDASIELLERLHRQAADFSPVVAAHVAGRLGRALAAGHRDLDRALALCESAHQRMADLEGADHPASIRASGDLARALRGIGRFDSAAEVLRGIVETVDQNNPGSLQSARYRTDLGHVLMLANEYALASEELLSAVNTYKQFPGSRANRSFGISLDNLACTLRDQGDRERANQLFAEAEQVFRELVEPHPESLATCYEEWGYCLFLGGDYEAAESKLRAALDWHVSQPEQATPSAASVRERLASLFWQTNRFDEAIETALEAERIRQRVHGEDHYLCGRPLEILATVRFMRGDLEGAERDARRMLKLRGAHYGPDKWQSWSDAWIVWTAMARRGELDAAIAFNGKALGPLREGLGASHPRHLRALDHRADLLRAVGRTAEADAVAEELTRLRTAR